MPFFVLGAVTLIVGFGMHVFLKDREISGRRISPP
jgi:hypothetical protein